MANRGNFGKLKEDLNTSPLVLFLGAGVSGSLVPTWETLIDTLLDYAVNCCLGHSLSKSERKQVLSILKGKPTGSSLSKSPRGGVETKRPLSAYEKAGIIKRFLGRQYIPVLRNALYGKYNRLQQKGNRDHEKQKSTLSAVAALCENRRIIAVVTYNYDDLLESCLNRPCHSIHGRRRPKPGPGRLPIYHVHGFVPHSPVMGGSDDTMVVLAQEEYFQTMLEPFSWQTTTQLYFLANHACLFVGASLSDLNMLRMLSHARVFGHSGRSYVLMCRKDIVQASQNRQPEDFAIRVWSTLFDDIGIRLIMAGDDYASVIRDLGKLKKHLDNLSKGSRRTRKTAARGDPGHGN